jgi:hypothetical protein
MSLISKVPLVVIDMDPSLRWGDDWFVFEFAEMIYCIFTLVMALALVERK